MIFREIGSKSCGYKGIVAVHGLLSVLVLKGADGGDADRALSGRGFERGVLMGRSVVMGFGPERIWNLEGKGILGRRELSGMLLSWSCGLYDSTKCHSRLALFRHLMQLGVSYEDDSHL
jgi:hypothetical protein